MNITRAELKASAKESMKSCRTNPYIITLVYLIITYIIAAITNFSGDSVAPTITGGIISFVLSVVTLLLSAGYEWWALSVSRNMDNTDEFKLAFIKVIPIFLLSLIVSIFAVIGFILIVIPGIIVGLGLSMSYLCYRDNIDAGFWEAIKESWHIMKGHKMDYFILELSFIPWLLLMGITFGIAGIYVIPYMSTTNCKFYDSIR